MTESWAYEGGPRADEERRSDRVTLIEGSTFWIGERNGDVVPGTASGLFVADTRFLSGWSTTVDGEPVEGLSLDDVRPEAVTHVTRLRPPRGRADSAVLVLLHRRLGGGMAVAVEVRNLAAEPRDATVRLRVDADFADLFEVKEGRRPGRGAVTATPRPDGLRLGRAVDGREYSVTVTGSAGATGLADGLSWRVTVPARSSWTGTVEVVAECDGVRLASAPADLAADEGLRSARERWLALAPSVLSADAGLTRTLAQGLADIASLRIVDPHDPERVVVAAGAPWFMTLFGRDSLLTSLMTLTVDPRLAVSTLRALAALQGESVDPGTEEQPGRILHETRAGPATAGRLGPRNAYYGTVDATPLFVVLLGEAHRFGVDPDAVRELLPHADRALDWVDRYGDRDGDGFVEYERATPNGLVNQGWKDSFDGVTSADGRLAEAPVALCEAQGYVYAAWRARAELARAFDDPATAERCDARAEALQSAFEESFWLPERGYYAMALDGDKRPVDSLASNLGHCLWSGVVRDQDRAARVAELLLSPRMFSGWGVRTLATDMAAYNPISYHNGSVWPHDNAIAVAGLVRYGFVDEARQVATAVLDAADRLGGRLPELFAGFDRDEFDEPVPYPTACSPQAWAAAAPGYLVRSLLQLAPDMPSGRLSLDPVVPWRYLPLSVDGLPLGGERMRLTVDASGWSVDPVPASVTLTSVPSSLDQPARGISLG